MRGLSDSDRLKILDSKVVLEKVLGEFITVIATKSRKNIILVTDNVVMGVQLASYNHVSPKVMHKFLIKTKLTKH